MLWGWIDTRHLHLHIHLVHHGVTMAVESWEMALLQGRQGRYANGRAGSTAGGAADSELRQSVPRSRP